MTEFTLVSRRFGEAVIRRFSYTEQRYRGTDASGGVFVFCTKCGSSNDDTARFCEKCGSALAAAAPAGAAWQPATQPAATTADPRMRGGARFPAAPGGAYAVGKTPILALLLSFILPGVGQFYNGDTKKGGIMLGGFLVSLMLMVVVIGIFGAIGIWIWSMVDAYRVASASAPLGR